MQSSCVWLHTQSMKINHQVPLWDNWSLTTHHHHHYLVLNNIAALTVADILIISAMSTILRITKSFLSFRRMLVHCLDWMMGFAFVPRSHYSTVTSRTLMGVWQFTSVVIISDIHCTSLGNLFKLLLQVQCGCVCASICGCVHGCIRACLSGCAYYYCLKELHRASWKVYPKFFKFSHRLQSILIFSILTHPCSCLVSYYFFGVFPPK